MRIKKKKYDRAAGTHYKNIEHNKNGIMTLDDT